MTPPEPTWVSGLRAGDAGAFDAVYRAYRPRIYGFLWRMTRRPEVAEELLQETFLRLARHAPRLDPDTRLEVWLFAVARNLWRSWARWSVVDGTRLVGWASSFWAQRSPPTPEAALAAQETGAALERALGALPPALREVAVLVGVEGLSPGDAAAVLGITPEAARQRWSRARAQWTAEVEVSHG